MKTTFLKKVMPVVLLVVAFVGAFSSNAMNKRAERSTNVQGFVKLNPLGTECDTPEMCSTIEDEICTVGNVTGATQLWGKNDNDRCIVELYRIH